MLLPGAESIPVGEVANWTPWKDGSPSTVPVWRSLRTLVFRTTSRLDPLIIGSINALAEETRCPPAICQRWRKRHAVSARQRTTPNANYIPSVVANLWRRVMNMSVFQNATSARGRERTDANHISSVNVRIESKFAADLA